MWYALISCDVFVREICRMVADSPHTVDVRFLEKGLHERPDYLRGVLQQEIDTLSAADKPFDAILLGYALCGNSTLGLTARHIPVVIPKAHDCIALFLGSRHRYLEEFNQNPGTYYYTPSAVERGYAVGAESSESKERKYTEYVAKYGEDNARYLLEMEESWTRHYRFAAFIDYPEFRFLDCAKRVREIARKKSLEYRELLGNLVLVKKLVEGDWDPADFLVLQAGQTIEVTNDEMVITASGHVDHDRISSRSTPHGN
ncbi:MAG TPA: DUF1638 domain-containing protein [Atribacteraceae bacterium]|nr:DUF1638 domain-containing protein [Atribacteraceae bacterium]